MASDVIQTAEGDPHGPSELRALQHPQINARLREIVKMAKYVRTIVVHYDKPVPFTFIKEFQLACKPHTKFYSLEKKNLLFVLAVQNHRFFFF
jgi:hypothetical protein